MEVVSSRPEQSNLECKIRDRYCLSANVQILAPSTLGSGLRLVLGDTVLEETLIIGNWVTLSGIVVSAESSDINSNH